MVVLNASDLFLRGFRFIGKLFIGKLCSFRRLRFGLALRVDNRRVRLFRNLPRRLAGSIRRAPVRCVLGLLLGCPRHDREPYFGTDGLFARRGPLPLSLSRRPTPPSM